MTPAATLQSNPNLVRKGYIAVAAYFVASITMSKIHLLTAPQSCLDFMPNIAGVIDYLAIKGRNEETSSAIFFYSGVLSPIAFASWTYLVLAGRRTAAKPRPWHPLIGATFAAPIIAFIHGARPTRGDISPRFSNPLLNTIIDNDVLYGILVAGTIWSITMFISLSMIYPCHLAARAWWCRN